MFNEYCVRSHIGRWDIRHSPLRRKRKLVAVVECLRACVRVRVRVRLRVCVCVLPSKQSYSIYVRINAF